MHRFRQPVFSVLQLAAPSAEPRLLTYQAVSAYLKCSKVTSCK